MPRSLSLFLTCATALLLGACDRESTPAAQPQEAASAENAPAGELSGTVDRSFAGQDMPDFTLTDPDGKTLALGDTGGKPVLLNLWATWCAPCVVEMPMLDGLAADLGDSVQVLTVSEDLNGADKVRAFFAEKKFANLPQWMDPNNDLAIAYGGGAALPLTVMYDAEGKELWRIMGGYDWAGAEARKLVTEATAGQAPATQS